MGNSILLAQLLGPYLFIVGIGIFCNLERIQQVAHEYTQSAALMYMGGIMALLFGLLIILFHNHWAANWTLLITLLGWLGLIKGIVLIVFPDHMKKLVQQYIGNPKLFKMQSVCVILLGLFLMVKGYLI